MMVIRGGGDTLKVFEESCLEEGGNGKYVSSAIFII